MLALLLARKQTRTVHPAKYSARLITGVLMFAVLSSVGWTSVASRVYAADPPVVSSVSPSSGSVSGGDAVTITGTGFASGATVKFGTQLSNPVTVINDTTITATVPANQPSTVDIIVTNPDTQQGKLSEAFRYLGSPPTVSSVTPDNGAESGGTNVTITGTNFAPPNSTTNTWSNTGSTLPGGLLASQTAVIGDTIYMFGGQDTNVIYSAPVSSPTTWTNTGKTLPGTYGYASLAVVGDYVYLFGGWNGSGSGNVIYRAPVSDPTTWTNTGATLPGALCTSAIEIIGDTIYLFGGFSAGAGSTNVIYSAPVSSPTTWTNTGATLPGNLGYSQSAVIGDTVYLFGGSPNAGGSASNVIYSAPVSSPTTWTNTGKTLPAGLQVSQLATIGEKLYLFGGRDSNVIYSASVSDPTTWTNTGKTLPGNLGFSQLVVANNAMYLLGGNSGPTAGSAIYSAPVSHYRSNQYNKPWIINWGTSKDMVDQSAVSFGGTPLTELSFVSPTQITATTLGHVAGAADVTVTNYDGQSATLTNGFTYNSAPTVSSISSTSGSASGGDAVTITGANFTDGATVTIGGVLAENIQFINATTITATTPAAESGTYDVVVINPDGQTGTLTSAYTYLLPPPSLASVSPASGSINGGTEVTINGTNLPQWSHRRLFTIDKSKVTGTLTDFSVAITVTDSTLKSVANGGYVGKTNGGDIKFVLPNGTKLSHEIEHYDPATGELVAWVKLPQLSDAADNLFYMYYGNKTVADQWDVNATWNSKYRAVWHFDELSGNVSDSTANANIGTNFSTTSTTGKIGAGRSFGGGSYISAGNNSTLNPNAKMSLSFWMKPTANNVNQTPIGKWNTGAGTNNAYGFTLGHDVADSGWVFATQPVGTSYVTGSAPASTYTYPANSWSYMVGVADGNYVRTYKDGVEVGTPAPYNGTLKTDSVTDFIIGRLNLVTAAYNFGGVIDEPRLLGDSVSSDWIAAEYANQNDPSTFYSVGADEALISVNFGSTAATNIVGADGALVATAPINPEGQVDVSVTTIDNQTDTLTNAYTYYEDVLVSSISPVSGSTAGGDTVTITGGGFATGATVRFGNATATDVTVVNDTTITATTPANEAYPADVIVINPDDQVGLLNEGYTYTNANPSITSIDPDRGPPDGGTNVTITGSGFIPPNISTNTWTAAGTTLPVNSNYASIAVVGDTIYRYGGQSSNAILSAPVSDPTTWTNTGKTLPGNKGGAQLAIIGSKLYLFGGYTSSSVGSVTASIYSASIADPTTWTDTGATLPAGRAIGQLAVIGNTVYWYGGSSSTAPTGSIFSAPVSDPTTWTNTGKSLPAGQYNAQIAVIGNTVYLFSGTNTTNRIYSAPTSDPTTWTSAGTLPVGISGAQLLVIGDTMYLLGGGSSTIYSAPTSDPTTWTTSGQTLPANLVGSQAAVIGNTAYLFGGSANVIYSASLDHYRPNQYNKPWITNWATNSSSDQSTVTFDGTAATNIDFVSPTEITATTPAHASGVIDVVATNYDGESDILGNGYTYLTPITFTAVTPSSGGAGGGDNVTITGTNFADGATVTFGDVEATSIEVVNSTTITAITPVHTAGIVDVTVTNTSGSSATLSNGYRFNALPTIASISPSAGDIAGGTNVTISGTGFDQDIDVAAITNGGTPSSTGNMPETLTYAFDGNESTTWGSNWYAQQGSPSVTSTFNRSYLIGEIAWKGCFYDPAGRVDTSPTISLRIDGNWVQYVATASLPSTYSLKLTTPVTADAIRASWNISRSVGCNTISAYPALSDASVAFDNVPATDVQIMNDTTITATTPAHIRGAVDVTMTAPDGQTVTVVSGYTYTDIPRVDSISPATGSANGGTAVTITGNNFKSGDIVTIGGISADNVIIVNSTTITADTPANTPGPANVTVTDPDDNTATLAGGFTYIAPTPSISNLSSTTGFVEGGKEVTITGTNFDPGYAKQVTVTNTSGTSYTNYPVKLTVDTAALIAAGKLRSDCSDLRIKASNKTTNLPYNIAAGCNTSSTEVWVQLPTLSGSSSATTYMTYGSASLADNSAPDSITTPPDSNVPTIVYGSEQRIMSVTFGGAPAIVSTVTSTTITVTTPEHSAANTSVAVTSFYGPTATAVQQFKYVPSAYAFTNTSLTQAAGQPGELVLEPRDNEGNPITASYDITFTLGSTSTGGLFATTENGSYGTNTVTLSAGQPNVSFFYKDSTEGNPTITATGLEDVKATQAATVTSKYRLLVTGVSSPVKAGVPSSVTVQAVDYTGQPLADYTGAIAFTSTDNEAVLPNNYTFTTDANGQHTFVNAVTMRTVGTWCVTATDTNNPIITGQQCSITVVAADAVTPAKLVIITDPQTFAATASSDAVTIQAQGADNTPSPVFTDTKVYIDTDSNTGEFSLDGATDWTSTAPFEVTIPAGTSSVNIFYRDTTAGTPSLTFVDTENEGTPADLVNASQTETVIAGAPSQLHVEGSIQLSAGAYAPYSAVLQDMHGNEAAAGNTTDVYFTATSATMTFSADSSGSNPGASYHATIVAGESSVIVYAADTATGSTDIMASDASPADGSAGLADDVISVNTIANTAIKIVGLPQPTDLTVHAERQLTFQFQDIYGNVAPLGSSSTIAYDSTSPTGQFAVSAPGWTANLPASYPISAGTSVTTIQYQDFTVGTPTVTANMTGLTEGSTNLTVVPDSLHHFDFSPPNQTLIAGQSGAVEITAYDQWNNETTHGSDVAVNLSSTSESGEFSLANSPWNPVSSVVLPANTKSVSVFYRDTTAGTPTLAAVDNANSQHSGIDTPTIIGAVPVDLYFVSESQVVAANTPSREVTIGLKDQYDNPTRATTNFDVTLTSPSSTGEFSADSSSGWLASKVVTFANNALTARAYFRDSTTGIHTINAASEDYGTAAQQIQIEPGVVGKLTLSTDTSMIAGSIYTVSIETQTADGVRAAVTQDTIVDLAGPGEFSLSDTSWSPVTNTVIAQGQAEKKLYFKPATAGTGTLTVTETPSEDWEDGQTDVNITAGPIHSLSFTTVPSSVIASMPSEAFTVSALDIYGNVTLVDEDTTVYLYSNQTEGAFATNSSGPWTAESVVIVAGSSGADFYYQTTKSGALTIRASDHNPVDTPDIDIVNASVGLTAEAGTASKLAFATSPQTIQIGQSSQQIKVSLRDDANNEAKAVSVMPISLTSSCATGTFTLTPGGTSVAQLTIPAGEGDGFFYYAANEIGDCTITASATGLTSASQTETITTLAPVPTSISIDTTPQTLIAGQNSTAITVTLKDAQGNVVAANTPLTISLSTSSVDGTFAPGAVTFQPGDTTKTFTYRDMKVGSPVVTASATGLTSASQTETITAGTLSKLSLSSPDTIVTAGQNATFTVQLQNEYNAPYMATSDTTVYLHSAGSGVISDDSGTISSLVVPSGQSTQMFNYNQTSTGSATLTASDVSTPPENPDTGLQNGVQTITIAPDDYYALNVLSGPTEIEAGAESTDFVVQAQDQYGNAVALPAQTPFPLSTTSSTGVFIGTNIAYPGQLVIDAGGNTGTFTYSDMTVGTSTLTVDGKSGQDATTQVDVIAGTLAQLAFVNPPTRFDRGGVSDPVVIALKNTHGTEVPVSSDTTVYLHTTSATGQFATSTSGPWTVSEVTVPNGSSRTTVYYRDDNVSPPATLTASDVSTPPESPDSGLTNGTTIIANDASDPAEFVLSPTQTIIANHPSTLFTVSVRDYHGNSTTPLEDTDVYLRSSSSAGEFSLDGVTWGLNYITLPVGDSNATFYYRDKSDGTPTITASDNLPLIPDTDIANATRELTITRQVMDHFRVTNISDPQNAGTPSSVVVSAVDADNYVIDWYAGTITFSSNDSNAVLPNNYTFKPEIDKGIHTFVNGIAFTNPGVKSVTVTDQSGKTGTQYDIDVGGASTGVVEKLAFIEPPSSPTLISGTPSGVMTVQLQDGSSNPIAAGVGGYPVRFTSSSSGGQFAVSRNGPWSSALTATVQHGSTFVNVYYRDSNTGTFTLTGADWRGGYDDPAVSNAQLTVVINANNDFNIIEDSQLYSKNALGQMVAAPWFFGHTSSGRIDGMASFNLSAQDIVNGDMRPVDWELAWRTANATLDTATYGGASSIEYAPDPVVALAGDDDFSLDVVAFDTTLGSSNSRTITAPVSPWRVGLTSEVQTDGQQVAFTLETRNDNNLSDSTSIRVKLLNDSYTETGKQLTIGSLTHRNTGIYTGQFNTSDLPEGQNYILHAEVIDGNSNILADVATSPFIITKPQGTVPDSPGSSDDENNQSDDPNTRDQTLLSPGSNDNSGTGNTGAESRNDSIGSNNTSSIASQILETIKRFAKSPAAPVVIPGFIYGLILLFALILLRQMYNELRRAHTLLAILKHEAQTSTDKTDFLRLCAHFLRTPITILLGAAEILKSQEQAGQAGTKLYETASILRTKAEEVIAETESDKSLQEITQPDLKKAYIQVYTSPLFWVPVVLSVLLTLGANALLQALGNQSITNTTIVLQLAAAVLIGVVLYGSLRARTHRQNERAQLEDALRHKAQLDEAKNRFIQISYEKLAQDVQSLTLLSHQLDENLPTTKSLRAGVQQILELLAKFQLLATINSSVLHASSFDPETVVRAAVNGVAEKASAKHITFTPNFESGILSQDEALLKQVVKSVLDNAVKFSPENAPIEISGQWTEEGFTLTVHDHGPGMQQDPEEMFQAFKRADSSLDFSNDGAGLSLYLDRLIMRHLGGSITAVSNSSSGTEVRLRLSNVSTYA